MLDQILTRTAVIGAAGKMGSGISLLALQEMALLAMKNSDDFYDLVLIDLDFQRLKNLQIYLKKHLVKFAEKNINLLRKLVEDNPNLVSNEEIIEEFLDRGLSLIRLETDLLAASQANIIFEAMTEDIDLKTKILKEIYKKASHKPLILTNTSSIPINYIDAQAHLENKILGFHFYNPPAVQRLIELIIPPGASAQSVEIAFDLAKKFNKIVVKSNDKAGFIGNGHFLREIVFACDMVRKLSQEMTEEDAITLVNEVSQKLLVRPMGIFQLVDYVGVDVVYKIGSVMARFLHNPRLEDNLILKWYNANILGGQYPDGSQKDGIFRYAHGEPIAVYDNSIQAYQPIKSFIDADPEFSWKKLQKHPDRQGVLKEHFESIYQRTDTKGILAQQFLENSRLIANELVKDGVADKVEDVNTVLINGFFHIYGAENNFIQGKTHENV